MSAAQLSILQGESWTREFAVTRNGVALGAVGWDIEFTLYDADDSSTVLFRSSTSGHGSWLEEGVLRVTIPRAVIASWDTDQAIFLLAIRNPDDNTEDEQGRSWTLLRGYLEVLDPNEPQRVFRSAGRERIYNGSDGVSVRVFGLDEAVAPAPAPAPGPAPGPTVRTFTLVDGDTHYINEEVPNGTVYTVLAVENSGFSVGNVTGPLGARFTVILTVDAALDNFRIVEGDHKTHEFAIPANVSRVACEFQILGGGFCGLLTRAFVGGNP